uniref:Partner of Nob1 n=1 Tax=Arundo donax TaxID=35708 RepID=A0A0A9GKX8_ARUDO
MDVDRTTSSAATGDSSSGAMVVDTTGGGVRPRFEPLMPSEMSGGRPQFRKVPVPSHRFAPLKRCWMEIYTLVYEHMKVDIRMNLKGGTENKARHTRREQPSEMCRLCTCLYAWIRHCRCCCLATP